MGAINLFHFHIPLEMDHIGILGTGLELVSLLQASSSPIPLIQMWPIFLYLCNEEGFLENFKGQQRKMFIFFTPKYFDSF